MKVFNYVTDHVSIHFFFYVNSLCCLMWFFLYYLLHLLSSDCFAALTSLQPDKLGIWIYDFLKIIQERVFVMKAWVIWIKFFEERKDVAKESIFRVSGDTNFENFSAQHQTWWWHLPGFNVSTGLPKKTCHWKQINLNHTTLSNLFWKHCSLPPAILALFETNLDDSIDSGNFFVMVYVLLIWKDYITHMHGLAVYMKVGLPFTWSLSLENSVDSYVFN